MKLRRRRKADQSTVKLPEGAQLVFGKRYGPRKETASERNKRKRGRR